MNIIFQDIDGPLIPLRMYFGGNRPFNKQTGSFVYDPVAVAMINNLCEKFNAEIVYNSAHNENSVEVMRHQAKMNGLVHIHDTVKTNFTTLVTKSRHAAIEEWLSNNKCNQWIVIDDIRVHNSRQVLVNYELGMTLTDYQKACTLFGEKVSPIIGVGQSLNGHLI
jgi:hypothetical protein